MEWALSRSHFTDEESESQKGYVHWPLSLSVGVVELGDCKMIPEPIL